MKSKLNRADVAKDHPLAKLEEIREQVRRIDKDYDHVDCAPDPADLCALLQQALLALVDELVHQRRDAKHPLVGRLCHVVAGDPQVMRVVGVDPSGTLRLRDDKWGEGYQDYLGNPADVEWIEPVVTPVVTRKPRKRKAKR